MNSTKNCKKCDTEKPLSDFHFRKDRNAYVAKCKKCSYNKEYQKKYNELNKKNRKTYQQEYYLKNKDSILIKTKKYYIENKPYYNEYSKQWYKQNTDRHKTLSKTYFDNNKDKIAENIRNRRRTDINFRIQCNLSRRMHHALKGHTKSKSTIELLGCSIEEFKTHIEQQFKEGMSWDNYGNKKTDWSLDHILPCSKFNLTNEQEQRDCCNYKNLQPMWHIENIKKSNKVNTTFNK